MMKALMIVAAVAAALGVGYFLGGRQAGPAKDIAVVSKPAEKEKVQYTCSMHPFIIRDEPGQCPICGMDLTPVKPGAGPAAPQERKVKYWVSSMDPNYVRDAPGKDAMGMDLVPVYEEAAPGQIVIDPATAQNMGIRTAAVERRDLRRTIRTVGLVTYEEPRQYSVNSKIEGWIERLYINETGQLVKKGQPLMEIYSPELVAAQQEYLLALETSSRLAASPYAEIANGARRLQDATRTRLKYWDINDQQINELTKSRQVRKTMTLYSPYHGVVTQKPAVEGMRVMSGTELLQISDISNVWVNADIYEYELPWVKVGLPAMVEFSFEPGKPLQGKITYIYPYVEGDTRTVKARIELVNPGLLLKPDMYADVLIEAPIVSGALAVPGNAVLNSGKSQTVFISLGEGRFAPRTVKTGVSDEQGYVQILEGLQEGEQVVTSAQFMLDSESKLREAIQKMTQPEPESPAPAVPAAEKPGEGKENLEDLFK
ncbi:MAG: efflux RND transporter periplasmic adaptor subunit [Desulfobulbaceae bacterium]|nr:efflux RND transporter periplasmic adaptor subunit [Desulfobulbaceae bacterium]